MKTGLDQSPDVEGSFDDLINGRSNDPFSVLGAHPVPGKASDGSIIRLFLPGAESVFVLDVVPGEEIPAEKIHDSSLFEATITDCHPLGPYRVKAFFSPGQASIFYDCYSFEPVLSEYDLYLYNEGNHYDIYEKFGAHHITHQGVDGVLFALWAPSASRVSIISDLSQWDGRRHQMRARGSSGIWELFIPQAAPGLLYKYEVRTQNGDILIKSDPMAFAMEQRPKTASIVTELSGFEWTDGPWLEKRKNQDPLTVPISIYEVHLGSWRRRDGRWLTFLEAAEELVDYVKEMGFNYLEFLPLAEHPFDGSWGYQVTGYYAATSRYGSPHDLMYLIDRCHAEGIGVIMDWVPAHFPRDAFALECFDGTHLYEHQDPRQREHQDWGTLIFNYGRNEVKNFLIANALFWMDKYHIDGLRVDAVASMIYLDYSRKAGEWIPNKFGGRENLEALEFLKTLNTKIYERFPGVMTIAEESTSWPGVSRPVHLGGLGFMFKWNMGWMHDMLNFMSKDPIHRRFHMNNLTFALLYAFHENFILPLSHDEVVHLKKSLLSKMPGDDWQKFANLRLLLGYMFAEPGKKMLFMGDEIGQWGEWNFESELEWRLLDWDQHRGLKDFVKDLNRLYTSQPAMHQLDCQPRGFEWIDFRDTDATVVAFIRRGMDPNEEIIFIFNFTPVPRESYRIGVNRPGYYRELLNSDSGKYWGSNVGLEGGRLADDHSWHGRQYSLNLTLPPLGLLVLKPENDFRALDEEGDEIV